MGTALSIFIVWWFLGGWYAQEKGCNHPVMADYRGSFCRPHRIAKIRFVPYPLVRCRHWNGYKNGDKDLCMGTIFSKIHWFSKGKWITDKEQTHTHRIYIEGIDGNP